MHHPFSLADVIQPHPMLKVTINFHVLSVAFGKEVVENILLYLD